MEREDLKQKVLDMVAAGHKKMKPGDLAKTLARSQGVDKKEVKAVITELISEGRLIYTYTGHNWLELPREEE